MIQLSQKEQNLLKDQQNHEKVCIQKYTNYANQAQDPQLKQLFQSYAVQEQQHLDTINQIMNGQVPDLNQAGQQQQQSSPQAGAAMGYEAGSSFQGAMGNQSDATLCNDMLMTEKYVSGAYDTAIFEFKDADVRQALNHIQKEEQQHGEGIFNYMQSRGMYQVQ
ncbi:spore coat protein [Syntrophomonas erecta]